MGYWKPTYMYFEEEQANRVLRELRRGGVKARMTSRKEGRGRVYTIYRWRV